LEFGEGSHEVFSQRNAVLIIQNRAKTTSIRAFFIVYCSFFLRVVQLAPDLQTEEEKPEKMWVLCRVGTTGILTPFKGLHHEIYKARE
jgi:hypothetical protein